MILLLFLEKKAGKKVFYCPYKGCKMQEGRRSCVLEHTRIKHGSEFPVGLSELAPVILKKYISSSGTIINLGGKLILIFSFGNYAV